MTDLRVGDIRRQIEGLPDDAPAFVDICGLDLPITFASGGVAIIDPPDAERVDGRWPTKPGLELWAGDLGHEGRDLDADRVARALASDVDTTYRLDLRHALRISRVDWPERVEQARSLVARLEGELAEVRRALLAVHADMLGASGDPEEPTVICQTCRTDAPCETRRFLDTITDPLAADADEFAGAVDPF